MSSLPHVPMRLHHVFNRGHGVESSSRTSNSYPFAAPAIACKVRRGPTLSETRVRGPGGRLRGRIRRLDRQSYTPHDGRLVVACFNVQGLNWRLIRHSDKLKDLIKEARTHKWNAVCMSDLHGLAWDWEIAEPGPKPQVVYIEEFVLIQ